MDFVTTHVTHLEASWHKFMSRCFRVSEWYFRTCVCLVGKLHLVRVTVPVLYPTMLPAGIDFHWGFQLPPFSLVVKSPLFTTEENGGNFYKAIFNENCHASGA